MVCPRSAGLPRRVVGRAAWGAAGASGPAERLDREPLAQMALPVTPVAAAGGAPARDGADQRCRQRGIAEAEHPRRVIEFTTRCGLLDRIILAEAASSGWKTGCAGGAGARAASAGRASPCASQRRRDSIRFAPRDWEAYRYGAKHWVSAAAAWISPRATGSWSGKRGRIASTSRSSRRARRAFACCGRDPGDEEPEFILRQNNTRRMVLSFEAAKKGEDKELHGARTGRSIEMNDMLLARAPQPQASAP